MSPPLLPTGSNCEADFAQKVHGKVFGPRGKIRNSSTVKVDYRHDGVYLRVKPWKGGAASTPTQTKRLHFKQMFGDYFMTQEGIAVAKPWLLRASRTTQNDFDGNTWNITYLNDNSSKAYQSRKKVFSTTTEYQRISPPYNVNDEIVAEQMDDTGISYIDSHGNPQAVTWAEVRPGRMWARRIDQSGF